MYSKNYLKSAKRFLDAFLPLLPRDFYSLPLHVQHNILGAAIVKVNHKLHCRAKLSFGATRWVILGGTFVVKFDKFINPSLAAPSMWGTNRSERTFYEKYRDYLPLCPCEELYVGGFAPLLAMPRCRNVGTFDPYDVYEDEVFEAAWDVELSDLHSNNIGRLNHRFVIIDYASNVEER